MKLQINLRNGQYIQTECNEQEWNEFRQSYVNSFSRFDSGKVVFVPGTKFDMVTGSDICSVVEIKPLTPTSFPPAV